MKTLKNIEHKLIRWNGCNFHVISVQLWYDSDQPKYRLRCKCATGVSTAIAVLVFKSDADVLAARHEYVAHSRQELEAAGQK